MFSLATDVSVGGDTRMGATVQGAEGAGQLAWSEVEEAVCSLAIDVSVGARGGGSAVACCLLSTVLVMLQHHSKAAALLLTSCIIAGHLHCL